MNHKGIFTEKMALYFSTQGQSIRNGIGLCFFEMRFLIIQEFEICS
jgi:hypothetical protein